MAAWIVASLPLLPVLLKYREVHDRLGLTRTLADIRMFSAQPASFLHPAYLIRFWPAGPVESHEQNLYAGMTVVLIALAGLVLLLVRRTPGQLFAGRSPLLFYAAATLLMWTLALGPGGQGQDSVSLYRPYTWLLSLPGFNGLRVPARFAMVGTLCLAMAASLAVAQLSKAGGLFRGRWRLLAGATVLVGLIADGITRPIPLLSPPGKLPLPVFSQQTTVIELPIDDTDTSIRAMYRSIFHRQPIVNGYSGHAPPHYNVLSLALRRGDASVLFYLARRRPLLIIVNDQLDHGRGFKQMIEALPGIQSRGASGAGSIFLLPPRRRRVSRRSGRRSSRACATPDATFSNSMSARPDSCRR